MFERFKPTWMLNSIYSLTPADLKRHGIKAILTDLDNTLIAWNQPQANNDQLRNWLAMMKKANISVIVVSNNNHHRLKKFAQPLGTDFVARAMKPFGFGVKKAKKRLNLTDDQLVLVGDQLLTDIAAANCTNIRSILVKPLVASDAWNTKINRLLEKVVRHYLLKHKMLDDEWRNKLNG
ncbi:YqeG family HAD IIIA-type phosphatase [Liquorilactobacillus sicerae]|uniref:YqeG family HAD IIIA-type phosphatase n=1 Tax=Liquorilactobacillus sicerae TaxID=1416943 RepID=UPI0024817616|nr:YqeG family HAD IIIA-type phosphatase [Liquorilactobacillus sicerae]